MRPEVPVPDNPTSNALSGPRRAGRFRLIFLPARDLVPDPNLAQVYINLAQVYKQINAPVGKLGLSSLTYANSSITSITSKDTTYKNYLTTIANITSTRNKPHRR
jgi:hypothetical protein